VFGSTISWDSRTVLKQREQPASMGVARGLSGRGRDMGASYYYIPIALSTNGTEPNCGKMEKEARAMQKRIEHGLSYSTSEKRRP